MRKTTKTNCFALGLRMIAFILLLGSLCGCFIACQDESDPENTESSTEGQTTEATTSATTAARTPKKPSVSQRPSGGGADGIVTIACIGDSITEGAILDEADTLVDSGSFTLLATDYFRPVQFFASGSSTIYLDYIKAFNVKE